MNAHRGAAPGARHLVDDAGRQPGHGSGPPALTTTTVVEPGARADHRPARRAPGARHGDDAVPPDRAPGRAVVDDRRGLVVVGPELHSRHLETLVKEVAVLEVGRDVTDGMVDVIRNDDAVGTRQAVDHLVDLGHRHIAFIDGGDNPGADRRRDGYRAAMEDHGLSGAVRVVPGGYTEPEGARAGVRLLADGLPTAVVAANDPCAIGLLDVVLRSGVRVPEDLSVIGYDDSRFGALPGIDLTSVRQDIPRTARLAVKTVAARLETPSRKPRNLVTRPKLVVRGTTAPPPPEGAGPPR